ncbi:hypothetical protein [Amycolatopsis kentuckyensis]|uniref:hypothetical protein n=1 Tax=Amycolatopsis kentuckyensis TaxID=218823 RepID=UPI000A3CF292|nr:hypothetical protein [Amycolatopsis kentuckyensis]
MPRYFIQRPQPIPAILWDGTNAAEVEAFVTEHEATFTDNGDGTVTVEGWAFPMPAGVEPLPAGHIFMVGMNPKYLTDFAGFQEVASGSTAAFDITQA